VTLRLNIPADFERITFEREKFGSRFQVIAGQLVTGIPWTPGAQWLRFTYTLPAAALRGTWQRALDAPCESFRVRVKHSQVEEIACDLPPVAASPSNAKIFQSGAGVLPAGHVIRVQLGTVALPWTFYARWAALVALAGLIVATAIILRRPRRHRAAASDDPTLGQDILHFFCRVCRNA
jgi:hypothetical protein